MTGQHPAGFPHSDIPGSKLVCSSPRLIAAYHVLHRLLVPRHPPCALSSLTGISKVHSLCFPSVSYSVVKDRCGGSSRRMHARATFADGARREISIGRAIVSDRLALSRSG